MNPEYDITLRIRDFVAAVAPWLEGISVAITQYEITELGIMEPFIRVMGAYRGHTLIVYGFRVVGMLEALYAMKAKLPKGLDLLLDDLAGLDLLVADSDVERELKEQE